MYTEKNKQEDLKYIQSVEENDQLHQAEEGYRASVVEAQQLSKRIEQLERCAGDLSEAQSSSDPLAMMAYTNWPTLKSQLLSEQRQIRNNAKAALEAAESANSQRQLMARKARQRIADFDEAEKKRKGRGIVETVRSLFS